MTQYLAIANSCAIPFVMLPNKIITSKIKPTAALCRAVLQPDASSSLCCCSRQHNSSKCQTLTLRTTVITTHVLSQKEERFGFFDKVITTESWGRAEAGRPPPPPSVRIVSAVSVSSSGRDVITARHALHLYTHFKISWCLTG